MQRVICCSNRETLAFLLSRADVSVVSAVAIGFDTSFPADIGTVLRSARPRAEVAVGVVSDLRGLGYVVDYNELLVFARGSLLARIDPDAGTSEARWQRIFDRAAASAHRALVCRSLIEYIDRVPPAANELTSAANDDPFAILGIEETATVVDAEKARKRLAPQYHPDRVKAAGLGPRLVDDAERYMKGINGAVEEISRRRGRG